MRSCLFISLVFLASLLFQDGAQAQVSSLSVDPLRQGHALLIGNSRYRDRRWPQLYDIPLQLSALEKGLKFHFEHVEVAQDLETEQLRSRINSFLRNYGNKGNARLLIYYAGHGYTELVEQRNEYRGYITGVDTPWLDGTKQTYDAARPRAISMMEIRAPLAEVLAQHVLFVFDSCFAGTIFTSRAVSDPQRIYTPDVVARLLDRPSRDFLTAGSANEPVPAHSPFPELFLAALNGEADRYQHGVISAADINAYLRDKLLHLRTVTLTPQQGRLPDAAFAQGEFLFRVTNPASAPPQRAPTAILPQRAPTAIKSDPPQRAATAILPQRTPTAIKSDPRSRLTKADVAKLFSPFDLVLERVRNDYVERPDEGKLLSAAIDAIQKAFPSAQRISIAGKPRELTSNSSIVSTSAKTELNTLHDVALLILNDPRSSTDGARLVATAIEGMLGSLDLSSHYVDAKGVRAMQEEHVGIELTRYGDGFRVAAPIDETPAAKAGIMANDIITHLDDEPVQGLTLSQAVEKISGPVNTKLKLKVMRNGQDKPVEVTITRDVIRVRSVRSRLEDDVGFIRITQFNEQTIEGLKKAITDLFAQAGDKLKGFIIDLRNNPGEVLDQAISVSAAISVSDAFLEKGEIVSMRGRNAEETQRFNARAGDLIKIRPVIVLINGGSASASEIVAGALQDHRRATVIGTRSFGKGSMQTIIPLGSGNGALRLTTARYFTPSGRSIQAKGISPDIEVLQEVPDELKARTDTRGEASLRGHLKAEGDEATGSQSYIPPDPKDDKALHTALDLIRGIQKNSAYPPNPKTAVPN
jgi:carboxyl-terminal processing protease